MCDSITCQKEKVPVQITVQYSVLKIISRDREEATETESEDSFKTTTALSDQLKTVFFKKKIYG